MYVALRLAAKSTILGATNGVARVKIQIKVSCVRRRSQFSETYF